MIIYGRGRGWRENTLEHAINTIFQHNWKTKKNNPAPIIWPSIKAELNAVCYVGSVEVSFFFFFLKQGQGWGDGHQAFTLTLAFLLYRTGVLPFSHILLPHPSLSHPPFPLFFSIPHTTPVHSIHIFTHSNPDNWMGPKIHSQDPNTWPFTF